jgi:hypothetical protein
MKIILSETQCKKLIKRLINESLDIDWGSKKVRKRVGHSDILYLSPAKILERVGEDMPDFDIRKQGVRIGDRLGKAKEFLRNVIENPEYDTVEATNIYLEWWTWGDAPGEKIFFKKPKMGISDGRHRLLAAYELGLNSFPIELFSMSEIEQEKNKEYLETHFK